MQIAFAPRTAANTHGFVLAFSDLLPALGPMRVMHARAFDLEISYLHAALGPMVVVSALGFDCGCVICMLPLDRALFWNHRVRALGFQIYRLPLGPRIVVNT